MTPKQNADAVNHPPHYSSHPSGPVGYERMKLKRQQRRLALEQVIIRRAVALGYCK